MSPAVIRARIANMMETYPLGFTTIAKMTDRQIQDICFHPRDENGALQVPSMFEDEEPALENELAMLDLLSRSFPMNQKDVEAAKQKLKEKYGQSS